MEANTILQNENESDQNLYEKTEINILQISSFEDLLNLIFSDKYSVRKFSKNLQGFCIESEKNNYICEKNEEYKIEKDEKNLFSKFIICKNRFDFQIYMSDLLFQYFFCLKNIKASNKKEYNVLKNIFTIFDDLKNNNLLMDDIQCIIEYGLLSKYNNNFFLVLFDINEKNVKQFLLFFDLKKYFLSNYKHINKFIFRFNELINSAHPEIKQLTFISKIDIILTGILDILDSNNEKDTKEIRNKLESFKKEIINSTNKEKIFELFFNEETFGSHLDILYDFFKIFNSEIDKQINYLISKNNRQITKMISKFIIKHASFIDEYINVDTLNILNEFSIENSFAFYVSQYMEGKNRLINVYNMFKTKRKVINYLVNILKNKLNKEKQAELIQNDTYNEEDEFELEEKPNLANNKNKYFTLPCDYKIHYISCEDDAHIEKSTNILNDMINSKKILDEYLGIDTEWKSSPTFLEFYIENISNKSKNKEVLSNDKSDLSDIIQIAGSKMGFIFDTKSVYKNEEIKSKIEQIFCNNKFIGFEFANDDMKIGNFFKKIVYKNKFIELSQVYKDKKNKKTPELKIIISEMFGKVLDKRDQISDWSQRPLLSNQIKYGILDAYVLIEVYNKLLYEQNK